MKTLRVIWALSENAALKIIYDITVRYQKDDNFFFQQKFIWNMFIWNKNCPPKTLVIFYLNSKNTKKVLFSKSWLKREQAVDTKSDLVLLLSILQD